MIPFRTLRLLVCFCSVPVWAARVEVTAASKGEASSLEPAWDEGLGLLLQESLLQALQAHHESQDELFSGTRIVTIQ